MHINGQAPFRIAVLALIALALWRKSAIIARSDPSCRGRRAFAFANMKRSPRCGSFEVRFPDGRPTKFFHFDDLASRKLRPEILRREQALEQARAFARAERDKG